MSKWTFSELWKLTKGFQQSENNWFKKNGRIVVRIVKFCGVLTCLTPIILSRSMVHLQTKILTATGGKASSLAITEEDRMGLELSKKPHSQRIITIWSDSSLEKLPSLGLSLFDAAQCLFRANSRILRAFVKNNQQPGATTPAGANRRLIKTLKKKNWWVKYT